MFGRTRQPETAAEQQGQHSTILGLIEQCAELRGRLRTIETEWDDMRAQIRKGYQRMEKAHERQLSIQVPDLPAELPSNVDPGAAGFAKKLQAMRG